LKGRRGTITSKSGELINSFIVLVPCASGMQPR
jgi:hypothetical protein